MSGPYKRLINKQIQARGNWWPRGKVCVLCGAGFDSARDPLKISFDINVIKGKSLNLSGFGRLKFGIFH